MHPVTSWDVIARMHWHAKRSYATCTRRADLSTTADHALLDAGIGGNPLRILISLSASRDLSEMSWTKRLTHSASAPRVQVMESSHISRNWASSMKKGGVLWTTPRSSAVAASPAVIARGS